MKKPPAEIHLREDREAEIRWDELQIDGFNGLQTLFLRTEINC